MANLKTAVIDPAPEEAARDLLRASGQMRPPVDLGRVLDLFPGVNAALEPLENDGYIIDVPDGAEILVNSRVSESRQRFTLAHEFGHYVRRVGLGGTDVAEKHAQIERWCDRFAVGLLMPKEWVVGFINHAPIERRAERIAHGPAVFRVSRSAFWLRSAEVTRAWVFELTLDQERAWFAYEVRPTPPKEVVSLAVHCARHSGRAGHASLSAHGLSASCVRIRSVDQDVRALVFVGTR